MHATDLSSAGPNGGKPWFWRHFWAMVVPLWLTTSFWMMTRHGGWPNLDGWIADDSWYGHFAWWSALFLNRGSQDGVVSIVFLSDMADRGSLWEWRERSQHLWVLWYLLFFLPWFVPRLRTLGFTLLQGFYATLQCAALILGYFGMWRSFGGC